MGIIELLKRHIDQMAPHQREREQGKLLIEALAEIERLELLNEHWSQLVKNIGQRMNLPYSPLPHGNSHILSRLSEYVCKSGGG